MTPIPQQIDDAMWRLAEGGTMAERAAFVIEHPNYCDEMERRISLLTRFKHSREPHVPKGRFVPSPTLAPANPVPNWLFAFVCLVVIASLGFAGVALVNFSKSRQIQAALARSPDARIPTPEPHVTTDSSRPEPTGIQPTNNAVPPNPPSNPAPSPETGGFSGVIQPTSPIQAPKPVPTSRWETVVTVRSDHTDLASAILAIAAQAHVSVELAPGLGNPEIQIDYRRQGAKAVLDDMGRTFGFSVLVQSETKALAVPATDPTATQPRKVGNATHANVSTPRDKIVIVQTPPASTKMGGSRLPPVPDSNEGDGKSGP